jgi:hypothetical protein
LAAEAREYRETLAFEKMTPEEREKYRLHRFDEDALDDVDPEAVNPSPQTSGDDSE